MFYMHNPMNSTPLDMLAYLRQKQHLEGEEMCVCIRILMFIYEMSLWVDFGRASISDKEVLSYDFVKPQSSEIGGLDYRISLKFDRALWQHCCRWGLSNFSAIA